MSDGVTSSKGLAIRQSDYQLQHLSRIRVKGLDRSRFTGLRCKVGQQAVHREEKKKMIEHGVATRLATSDLKHLFFFYIGAFFFSSAANTRAHAKTVSQ